MPELPILSPANCHSELTIGNSPNNIKNTSSILQNDIIMDLRTVLTLHHQIIIYSVHFKII